MPHTSPVCQGLISLHHNRKMGPIAAQASWDVAQGPSPLSRCSGSVCGWAWMAHLALQQVRALSELTSRLLRLLQLLPQQCQFLLQDKHPCVSCLGQAFGSTPVRRSLRGQGFRDRQQLSELFKEGLHRCPCSQRLLSV